MTRKKIITPKAVGERMCKIRTALGKTQTELGKIINLSVATVSQIEKGRTYPSMDVMYLLANLFDVNIDFIVTGRGRMFNEKKDDDAFATCSNLFGRDSDQILTLLKRIHSSAIMRAMVITESEIFYKNNVDKLSDLRGIEEDTNN